MITKEYYGSLVIIVFITGFIYAYKMNNVDIINIIKIGKIDIDLKIYENDNVKEIELTSEKNIGVNNQISYIPVISKTGISGDCYVRLKINLYNSEETVLNIS